MTRRSSAVLWLALLLLPASRATAQTITAIELTVVPETGGHAFVNYAPGGLVRGGHLSGDSPPFVHQAEGRLSREQAVALWRAAQAMGESLLTRQDTVPTGGRGYIRLQIERRGRPPAYLVWPFGTEHADPRVRAVVGLAMAHRVGGW